MPIINKNSPKIKEDLIYFKNDILKDIKNTESRLNEKFETQNNSFQKKVDDMEIKTNTLIEKLSILSKNIPNENINSEKIALFEGFQKEAKETLYTHDYRIKKISNELQEALIKYDKIILDSIFYPGIIGKNSKFKTFRELIEFLLTNVNKLLNHRAKEEIENKKNKNKEFVTKLQMRNEFNINNFTELIKTFAKENEQKYMNKIDNLKKQILEINEKYYKFQEKIHEIKNDVDNIVKENMKEFYMKYENMNIVGENNYNKQNECEKDIELVKLEVNNINLILKDLIEKLNTSNAMARKRNSMFKNINRNYNINFNSDISKALLNNIKSNDTNLNNIIDNNINDNLSEKKSNKNLKINYPFLINTNSIIKQYIDGTIKIEDINKHDKIISRESNSINNNMILNQLNADRKVFSKKNEKKENIKNNKQKNNQNSTDNEKIEDSEILENEFSDDETKTYNNNSNNIIEERKIIKNKNNSFNDINLTKNENYKNNNSISVEKNFSLKLKKPDIDNNNLNDDKKEILIINPIKNIKKSFKETNVSSKRYESNQEQTPRPVKKTISSIDFPMKIINLNENKNKSISYIRKNNYELYLKEKIIQNQNKIINIQQNKKEKEKEKNKAYNYNKINLGKEKDGKINKIEIDFDDEVLIQKKENEKFENNIEQIKDILPKDEKSIFMERMEKLGYKKDKSTFRKNRNSVSNIRPIKKYQINSINKSSDFKK